METFAVQVRLTDVDFWRMNRNSRSRSSRVALFLLLIIFAMIGVLAYLTAPDASSRGLFVAIVLGSVLVLLLIIRFLLLLVQRYIIYRNAYRDTPREYSLEITPTKIISRFSGTSGEIYWQGVQEIRRTRDSIYIMHGRNDFLIVPLRCFESPEQARIFLEHAQQWKAAATDAPTRSMNSVPEDDYESSVSFSLSPQDYWISFRYINFQRNYFAYIILIALVLIVYGLPAIPIMLDRGLNFEQRLDTLMEMYRVLSVGLVIFFAAYWFILRYYVKHYLFQRNNLGNVVTHIQVLPGALLAGSERARGERAWRDILDVTFNGAYIFIFVDRLRAVTIPASAFPDAKLALLFFERIESYFQAARSADSTAS
ncbi:MAG: YcxB family protein [Leptospiraceae bacterium]|nr:YcxB family protein [Leptospiraceae bacterium]MCB1321849.1 YcxB family protein [Leptospiraceae bacterium]